MQAKWIKMHEGQTKYKILNLTSHIARGVKPQSQQQIYAEKQRFKEELFKFAEKLVLERRQKIRQSKIETIRYKSHPSQNYENKNSFLENNIESTMMYFMPSAIGQDQEINYMIHLRNILLKNEILVSKSQKQYN